MTLEVKRALLDIKTVAVPVSASKNIWEKDWVGVVDNITFPAYFLFAVKAPLSRKNHRLAHMIILPAVIILTIAMNVVSTGQTTQLWESHRKVEQAFYDATDELSSKYGSLWNDKSITSADIDKVLVALVVRDEKNDAVVASIRRLQAEFEKQLASPQQQNTLRYLQKLVVLMEIHKQQAAKVAEVVNYIKTQKISALIDLPQIQEDRMSAFGDEIDELGRQLKAARQDLDKA